MAHAGARPPFLVIHAHRSYAFACVLRVEKTVLLQAAQTVTETEFLLALARETAFVGWVDFTAQDVVDQIARLATDPLLVGLHPMVQDKILPITTGSCEPI